MRNGGISAGSNGERASNASDVSLAAATGVDRAGGEHLEGRPVASVNRNIAKLLLFENVAYPRVGGFKRRGRGLHLKLFRYRTHLKLGVDSTSLADEKP